MGVLAHSSTLGSIDVHLCTRAVSNVRVECTVNRGRHHVISTPERGPAGGYTSLQVGGGPHV